MMSLTKLSSATVINKQYKYKLKAYFSVFNSLVIIQLVAILLSFNGTGSIGGGSENIQVYVNYYSADMVIIFTLLWAFITAIVMTTKAYRDDDFAFVTNRVTSNVSNVAFLLTASMIGGITAMLSSFLLKIGVYVIHNPESIQGTGLVAGSVELFWGIVASMLYVLLFSALGYLVGTIVQLSRVFMILLPVIFFGVLFISVTNSGGNILQRLFEFYFMESSFLIFMFKALSTIVFLFISGTIISNRMEVRR